MKRSALLAGLMVLTAASSAAAQGRPAPSQPAVEVRDACPPGAYSVVQSPDGTSVSVLFHNFTAEVDGSAPARARATCRIQIPLAAPVGYSLGLASVDYRGFAILGRRQSAQIMVDYEVGRGNRAPRFQRRLQGRHEGDFAFVDRLPPGQLRQTACGARNVSQPVLAIEATLALNSAVAGDQAMVTLDSADQGSVGALHYRFNVRSCGRSTRMTDVAEITSD